MTASDNLYLDKGLTNWMKIIAAFAVIFHHYSQYALSELGESMRPILDAMQQWGMAYKSLE